MGQSEEIALNQKMTLCLEAFSYAVKLAEDVRGQFYRKGEMGLINDYLSPILPIMTIQDKIFQCNGIEMNLQRKPMTLKLFKIFLRVETRSWERDNLVRMVYSHLDFDTCSDRMKETLRQNTVKLLSRARSLADQAFHPWGLNWLEWFSYNADTRTWSLYRVKTQYLMERDLAFFQRKTHPLMHDSLIDGNKPIH